MKLIDLMPMIKDYKLFIYSASSDDFEGYLDDVPYKLLNRNVNGIGTVNISETDEIDMVLEISVA